METSMDHLKSIDAVGDLDNQDEQDENNISQDSGLDVTITKYLETFIGDSNTSSLSSDDDDTEAIDEWREISRRLDISESSESDSEVAVPVPSPPVDPPKKSSRCQEITEVVEKPKKFDCTLPKRSIESFKTDRELERHLENHADTKLLYMCVTCTLRFETPKDLKNHIDRKHGNDLGIESDESEKQQTIPPSTIPSIFLAACSRNFRRGLGQKIQTTKKRNELTSKFKCNACYQSFRRFTDLWLHLRVKHADSKELCDANEKYKKMRTCRYCDKTFLSLWMRKKHVNRMHLVNNSTEDLHGSKASVETSNGALEADESTEAPNYDADQSDFSLSATDDEFVKDQVLCCMPLSQRAGSYSQPNEGRQFNVEADFCMSATEEDEVVDEKRLNSSKMDKKNPLVGNVIIINSSEDSDDSRVD